MIIGITGSLGGGKGTVVAYLMERYGFTHVSVSGDVLTAILEERGDTVDRDGMARVGNELRAADPAGVIQEAYRRYEDAGETADVIIESLHTPAEARFIKEAGGVVLGVTADADIRYERIVARGSVKDNVSKEQFIAQTQREEEESDDLNTNNIFATLREADFTVENNTDVAALHSHVDEIMTELGF